MRRKIKCYLVFAPLLYRVIIFAAMPIALLVLQVHMSQERFSWTVVMNFNMMIAFVLPEVEILFDHWAFGGIAAREGMQLTYLKTSARGVGFLGTALGINLLRQFLTGLLPMFLGFACRFLRGGGFAVEYVASSLAYILLGYVFLVASSTIARFFDGLLINYAVATIVAVIMIFPCILVSTAPIGALAVLLMMSVVVSVAGVKIILNRVKESFYDKAD